MWHFLQAAQAEYTRRIACQINDAIRAKDQIGGGPADRPCAEMRRGFTDQVRNSCEVKNLEQISLTKYRNKPGFTLREINFKFSLFIIPTQIPLDGRETSIHADGVPHELLALELIGRIA